ncbi:FimV/HubP family polar landmark protein [Massilia sp. PWRC2]|uniref:FimV/HubP family polar landmark protein n=1 Tax=Massilia sp. PWRC2 TaxID=2804626 RepID=UPI003CE7EB40
MPLQTRPRILSLALKSLFGAVATAVVLSSAHAAGLGKLTVLSSLGQPLRAEIELTAVSADEAAGLVAKLASADAFKAANVEFNPALMGLRFAVEQRGGRQVISVTSSAAVNEPFVDMLLELSWNSGRLVREYTFLLDPAELRATQSAQVAAAPVDVLNQGARPLPAARNGAAATTTKNASAASTPAPAQPQARSRPERAAADPAQERAARPAGNATEVTVRAGDSLGKIAARVKPTEISLDMMLVALYRANPDAFVGNNMNRLKSGQILSVPDADSIRGGASDQDAHGVVVAHAADFNAYRNKLAGQVASAAPSKSPEAAQSAAGKVSAKVEERPTAANESKDRLKLSKADASGAAAAGKAASAAAEDKIAKERALADASARVKELEKNVNDLEKLMVVKNKAGTAASATAEAATAAPAALAVPAAAAPVAAAPVAPVVPKPARKMAPPPPPPAEPTLVETLMDNITSIGAGVAVLLLGGYALARRRKQAGGRAPSEPSILGAPTDHAQSMFAHTGGASVDTSNSVFNSSFAPSASQLDTNEVDPIAEADVYIAYGRDAQAEEILKEALRNHPERHPVRLKLLEIYAARKDPRAFETQAGELYALTRGQGDEWPQAAALGLSIDPTNPMYASAGAASRAADAQAEQDVLRQMAVASGETASFDAVDLGATALPVAAAAAPAQSNSLDFDLGSLSFDEPAPTVMATPPAGGKAAKAQLAEEETFDLSFDMDFDKPTAVTAAAPALKSLDNIHLDLAHPDLPADVNSIDLSGAFDLPALPGSPESRATPVPATAANGAYSASAPLVNPLERAAANSMHLPATASAQAGSDTILAPVLEDDPFALPDFTRSASPAVSAGNDLPELAFASPPAASNSLDFAAPSPAYTSAPQFDMSGIDLDLPAGATGAAATPVDLSAAHMEMETKLDLAIAYQEIGDKEGARELLDEVVKGGSDEQIGRANEMRVKLA